MKEPIRSPTGATLRPALCHRIASDLRRRIQAGDLPPGARLPSSRALAHELGVSRNTIVHAYETLASEGLVVTRIGSGTRVRGPRRPRLDPRQLLRDAHYPSSSAGFRDPDGNLLNLRR
jgi:DNA-binding GntR family transcriptional regulator